MSLGLARYLVFSTAATVLVMEVLAGRLLAPYLGISLEVFTGIIGVILAGISTGAWVGGRLADRSRPERLLGPFLIAGGLTAVASPLIVDLLGPDFSPDPFQIVVISSLAFFLPAAVLSAVPPVVVKIRLASLEETGSVVGSFSAIGTAGALMGTFLTGFVLIAAFPTRPIIFAVGGLMAVTGFALSGTRSWWSLGALALLGGLMFATEGPCEHETTYHCAVVSLDPSRPTGRLLILDTVRNSYVDLADPFYLEFRYLHVVEDVVAVHLGDAPLDAVHIGGGGFTYPRYLTNARAGTVNTILEIDSKLVDIAVEELGFDTPEDVIVDDARQSIEAVGRGSMDLVVGDAFSGFSVPWHLTTVEFIESIASRLRPGGLYVANIIDYPPSRFIRAEMAAMSLVFDHVAVFAPVSYFDRSRGGNFVVVGSDQPIDVSGVERAAARRGGREIGLTGSALADFVDGARALTDDFAPVDQLLTQPFAAG